jgi:5-formyltetrahydrofolate cyclo-ligase
MSPSVQTLHTADVSMTSWHGGTDRPEPSPARRADQDEGYAMGTGSPSASKADLRRELRAARRARPTADVEHEATVLGETVCALAQVQAARRVAAYVSRPLEPPTGDLLGRWRAQGLTVLLPIVLPDLDLDWALDGGPLLPGRVPDVREPQGERLGPLAIATADVVVVPALAVDRAGRRLGQGGGCYDRALARLGPHTLTVALVHPDELVEGPLPTQPHDRRVDVVVTAREVHRVTSRD